LEVVLDSEDAVVSGSEMFYEGVVLVVFGYAKFSDGVLSEELEEDVWFVEKIEFSEDGCEPFYVLVSF
jgi:putative AlgH/UPF0301 family transcriptional regulator